MSTRSRSQPAAKAAASKRGGRSKTSQVAQEIAANLTDEAVAKAQEKLAAKARVQAERAEKARNPRTAMRARSKQAVLEALAQADPVDLWTRAEPADRRPRFTRDQIAEAALRIADTEGFDALSMRRLAAELDAGTMTLYHYVRTKDELLALVSDLVMGEVALPDGEGLPDDWRGAITIIARRSRDALLRHPWVLEVSDDPPIGPNAVRHFDQTMEALSTLDVGLDEKIDVAMLVDEYVFGYCMQRRINDQTAPALGAGDRVVRYVQGLVDTGRYPAISELVGRFGFGPTWDRIQASFADDDRFDRNLQRILDGVEASAGRGAPRARRSR